MSAADARRGADGAANGSERAASMAARACSDDVLHTKMRKRMGAIAYLSGYEMISAVESTASKIRTPECSIAESFIFKRRTLDRKLEVRLGSSETMLIGENTPYIAYEEPVVPPPRRPPPPSCWRACWRALCGCCGQRAPEWRTIFLNASPPTHGWYPHNRVENTKYGLLSFVPKVLLEQFRYFFNLYFLLVALSQFVPVFEIGLRFTYIAPLVFVLAVTMAKEGYDDVQRWRTDRLINNEAYERLQPGGGSMAVPAKDLRVGDVVRVSTNQRIPADLVLLRTSSESGVVFVRTDQLDGETDWKLRVAVASTQRLASELALSAAVVTLHAAPPTKDIYEFVGDLTLYDDALEGGCMQEPLALENTLWANTVLASCACHGVVVHTGKETRSSMNVAGAPPSKMATLDLQVNFMTKLLFVLVNLSALLMVAVPFGQVMTTDDTDDLR